MKRILIVEDDRALGDGLCLALRDPSLELALCRTLSADAAYHAVAFTELLQTSHFCLDCL